MGSIMKILIVGAGFGNKGAEAMLRTVQFELTKRLKVDSFFLWRPIGGDTSFALASGFIPLILPFQAPGAVWKYFGRYSKFAWSIKETISGKLKKYPQMTKKLSLFEQASGYYLYRKTNGVDAIIDISGFAYSDIGGLKRVKWVRPVIEYCSSKHKKIFFLPQAWGPFENVETRNALSDILNSRFVEVYSRDKVSSNHLQKLLKGNTKIVKETPDIAFCFRGGTRGQGRQILKSMGCELNRPIVGVSPNMRVYERCAGKGNANIYLRTLTEIINYCIEKHDVDIILQANEVFRKGEVTDDMYLCSLLASTVQAPHRCFMTREYLNAEESKALIGNFDYLIGSRFHSFVFALSQGIPSLAISWSHKYRELFSLFELENHVFDLKDLVESELIRSFETAWLQRKKQSEKIGGIAIRIQDMIMEIFDNVSVQIKDQEKIYEK